MRDRLQALRYLISDLLFVLGRFPRAVAGGIAGFWRSLPIVARRRLVAAGGVIVVVLLFAGLAVPNLPSSLPGGDECAPEDDAIELVPAGALAYVHANLDPETDQAAEVVEVAGRMPQVSRQLIGQVATLLDAGAPLGAASEPWFGGEAAAAVLGTGAGAEQVQLVETTDAAGARRYAESIAAGVTEASTHREVEITEDGQGVASAVVGDFLALGAPGAVRAVVDVATGAEGADALVGDPVAAEAFDALPEHRVADAYLSRDGIETLVAAPASPLSTFEPLVDASASRGAAVALSATDDGLSVAIRSALDPESEPGFFGAFEEFEPELPGNLQPDALAYLGLGQPGDTASALLRQATLRAPGIAAGAAELVRRIRGRAEVDLEGDLLEALGGEAALAVIPREPLDPEAGAVPATGALTPYMELLAGEVDDDLARDALARLQEPIARSLDPGLGAPVFDRRRFGDLDAQVLRLSPVAQLVYATYESKLMIANDAAAVEWLAEGGEDALAETDRYREAVDELPDELALLAYLDLRGLLSYAERSGLAEDSAYNAFAPDLRRLDALGFGVSLDESLLAVDVRLLVD